MKKITFLLSLIISISINAQLIPNGDFENWVQEPWGEEPANWGEANVQLVHSIIPGIVSGTILKSQDSYSGSYAMELRSIVNSLFGDTITPLVMLNLKNAELDSAYMTLDSTLLTMSGYIKQGLVSVDSNMTAISVMVYANGNMTGIGAIEFETDITSYTRFDIPIFYFGAPASDSVEVYIYGGNPDLPTPGNIMKLDAFEFTFGSPSTSIVSMDSDINIYPNPFNELINIELNSSEIKEFKIYSLTGKVVYEGVLETDLISVDLSNLPPNVYLLRVGNEVKKLVKKK
jgi:hypothetical protein